MTNITANDGVLGDYSTTRLQKPGAGKSLEQDQFLELMIAQIQNQDPFKPLENGEFLSQMAQFSTVSGIQDLQDSFSQLAGSLTSNQALQASALVGRHVLVPSSTGLLFEDGVVYGTAELDTHAAEVRVTVKDVNGQVMRQVTLGSQPAGQLAFSWDGETDSGETAEPGIYQFEVSAVIDGKNTALNTFMAARVDSVTLGRNGQGTVLNLAGQGTVDLTEVREIM